MLEKIRRTKNLPILLFVIIIINLLPLALPNMISKQSHAANTILMFLAFAIQCGLLVYFMYKKMELTKENTINLTLLCSVIAVLICVQVKNLFLGTANIMDIANIVCKFANILLLYIAMLNIKTEEKGILTFMKAILYLAVFACLFNMIFYSRELIGVFFEDASKYFESFKSFFANRNQFSFFLFIAIATNIFIIIKDNKLKYKLTLALLIFNLILGMSRTGMLVVGIFLFLSFITTDKVKGLVKLEIAMIIAIICMIIFIIICKISIDTMVNLVLTYLRPESITSLSGRTDIWNIGLDLVKDNFENFLVGVGRFKGVESIKEAGKRFTQFHNTYIETLVSGGIIELIYIMYIYINTYIKVIKSDMNKNIKRKYLCFVLSYFIYMIFESLGRFSIGFVDVTCIICFITIPLLHANSIKDKLYIKSGEKNK